VKVLMTSVLAAMTVAFAGAALAETPSRTLEERLAGNTLRITNRLGDLYVQFLPDGSYRELGPNGVIATGGWLTDGNRVCITQTQPAPPAAYRAVCETIAGREVGESWSRVDPRRGEIRTALLEGHVAQR